MRHGVGPLRRGTYPGPHNTPDQGARASRRSSTKLPKSRFQRSTEFWIASSPSSRLVSATKLWPPGRYSRSQRVPCDAWRRPLVSFGHPKKVRRKGPLTIIFTNEWTDWLFVLLNEFRRYRFSIYLLYIYTTWYTRNNYQCSTKTLYEAWNAAGRSKTSRRARSICGHS